MRILMLPTINPGIKYWRFDVPAKQLRATGHEVTVMNDDLYQKEIKPAFNTGNTNEDMLRWIMQEDRWDLIHNGYTASPDYVKMLAIIRHQLGIPFITDLDDNYKTVPHYNSGARVYGAGHEGRRVLRMLLRISDGVTFSTEPLTEALKEDTVIRATLHNYLEPDDWSNLPTDPVAESDESIRILMTGGLGRFGDWQIVRECLEHIMDKYGSKVKLLFMGCTPDWAGKWMTSATDPSANQAFYLQPVHDVSVFQRIIHYVEPDIILSPLEENEFNKSKSAIKFLESAMVGAAFVCTDYPTYSIAPNDCCIKLSNTTTQWTTALEELITDDNLRQKIHMRARDWCLAKWDGNDYINNRVSFYEKVLEKGPVKGLDDIVRPKVGV